MARMTPVIRRAILAMSLALCALPASADAGWFESGDMRLRLDLLVLNDAEIIRLPVNQWPMPRAAVSYAIAHAKEHLVTNGAVAQALERVRQRLATADGLKLRASVSAGEAALLRDFDSLAREDLEAVARADHQQPRFSVGVSLSAVADPADGQQLRSDGSHATIALGNWLISAHKLDRYWGPSYESSLILSNNARPMPTVMLERAEARAPGSPLLSWIGPWRMSFGVSRMEDDRADIDSPLFLAWRFTIMPFKDIELGFSRTAQFCGEQLKCDLSVFGNLLIGNDNVGIDATPENEPGNQMAGFDIRWNSPLGNLPYAVYAQYIGEDESSYLPAKYLAQLGLEGWKPMAGGGIVHWFGEYTTTTCSASTSRGPYYECAYNQGRFNVEGYRYRGRVIGYTSDRDAENYAFGLSFTAEDGQLWSATMRNSRLNRDDFDDFRNTVSSIPMTYRALELGWRGRLFGQSVSIDAGAESREPAGGAERGISPYGFVRWTHDWNP